MISLVHSTSFMLFGNHNFPSECPAMTGWENSRFSIEVALTVSGKYQNKEKPLKRQRRLRLGGE